MAVRSQQQRRYYHDVESNQIHRRNAVVFLVKLVYHHRTHNVSESRGHKTYTHIECCNENHAKVPEVQHQLVLEHYVYFFVSLSIVKNGEDKK
jgi:hypothetical protein